MLAIICEFKIKYFFIETINKIKTQNANSRKICFIYFFFQMFLNHGLMIVVIKSNITLLTAKYL